MATGRVQDICAMMKRFIEMTKREIKGKEETIGKLRAHLQKLSSQPNPDQALIRDMKADIERLERELEENRGQLVVLEEEFSAECGGQ